jgi:hypothetical protein
MIGSLHADDLPGLPSDHGSPPVAPAISQEYISIEVAVRSIAGSVVV